MTDVCSVLSLTDLGLQRLERSRMNALNTPAALGRLTDLAYCTSFIPTQIQRTGAYEKGKVDTILLWLSFSVDRMKKKIWVTFHSSLMSPWYARKNVCFKLTEKSWKQVRHFFIFFSPINKYAHPLTYLTFFFTLWE